MNTTYYTIAGRVLSLSVLTLKERHFLGMVYEKLCAAPPWEKFSNWWRRQRSELSIPQGSVTAEVASDIECRLGIAQGKMTLPDYRSILLASIEERFKSRNEFCQNAGLDPAQLSRVLSGRADFSVGSLDKIAESLDLVVTLVPRAQLESQVALERAQMDLVEIATAS